MDFVKITFSVLIYFWVSLNICDHGYAVSRNSKEKGGRKRCGYDACELGKTEMLNVHICAHTHDDVGWLKTIDGYFYGKTHRAPYGVHVKYKIDKVMKELKADPKRRFIYVEMAFFTMWWNEQDKEIKEMVKEFVNTGRLEFISGAWCMNDEATTHYNAIIDQHTLGLKFLKDTFGECGVPRLGWQVDPFGHSREIAALSAQFGYDGLFFGRLDYQEKEIMMKNKKAELMWMASESLGDAASIFTGVIDNLYWPPEGIRVLTDVWGSKDGHSSFVDQLKKFIVACKDQAKRFSTNHIMMTMGGDFKFERARDIFTNLDMLIKHVNEQQTSGEKINLFYSTPSCYTYALNKANQTYTKKEDDFFPYASKGHTFWTGYFTSRPALKGYVRESNTFLQICKQVEALSGINRDLNTSSKVDVLRQAMAVVQHHDGVSINVGIFYAMHNYPHTCHVDCNIPEKKLGTEREHVAADYCKRLANGITQCQEVINMGYQALLPTGTEQFPFQEFCLDLNISVCKVSTENDNFTIIIYNPLARHITYWVRVPVNGTEYTILDSHLNNVESLAYENQPHIGKLASQFLATASKYTLIYKAELSPLGISTFFAQKTKNKTKKRSFKQERSKSMLRHGKGAGFSIQNEVIFCFLCPSFHVVGILAICICGRHIKLTYSDDDGLLKSITNLDKDISTNVHHELLFYKSFSGYGRGSSQASGAYVFRPDGTAQKMNSEEPIVVEYESDMVKEIHTTYNTWAHTVHRLYKGEKFVEIEWTVGPIPPQALFAKKRIGKEVISRFITDLSTNKTFYTDSNGRGYIKRVIDFRPAWNFTQTEPIAGNYYPVNSKISIIDEGKNVQLTVLTDRAQGGASIRDGELELMIHRRLFRDDSFGVQEPLNEPGFNGKGLIVKGIHRLFLDTTEASPQLVRDMEERIYMAPSISFSKLNTEPKEYAKKYLTQWTGFTRPLPPNVHLLTLEAWSKNSYLLRLEHFYEKGSDKNLSRNATVSLQGLFENVNLVSVEELTLAGNQLLKNATRLSWNVEGHGKTASSMNSFVEPVDPATLNIVLKPMQIRTFQVTVKQWLDSELRSQLIM